MKCASLKKNTILLCTISLKLWSTEENKETNNLGSLRYIIILPPYKPPNPSINSHLSQIRRPKLGWSMQLQVYPLGVKREVEERGHYPASSPRMRSRPTTAPAPPVVADLCSLCPPMVPPSSIVLCAPPHLSATTPATPSPSPMRFRLHYPDRLLSPSPASLVNNLSRLC